MDRKLPGSIDYSAVLPMSVPAMSRRRKFYPVNGGSFSSQGNSEIRIQISSQNALLDPAHSYLDFSVTNSNAAAAFSPDTGGAAMFFSRLRIEQAGVVLSLIDGNNPLTIILTMDDVVNMGLYAPPAAVPTASSMVISGISYAAQLVEVGSDVISQFGMMRDMMGGQLALSGHDWEHNSETLAGGAAGGGGERIINIPMRKRSIKSLFWVANSNDIANVVTGGAPAVSLSEMYNKSFGGTCNMSSYQLKVGSVVYPPTPIQGPGDSAAAVSQTRRGECLQELAKAMGTLSFTSPTGRCLNTLTYCADIASAVGPTTASGDNGGGGAALLLLVTSQRTVLLLQLTWNPISIRPSNRELILKLLHYKQILLLVLILLLGRWVPKIRLFTRGYATINIITLTLTDL